jgi:hypothetical protein
MLIKGHFLKASSEIPARRIYTFSETSLGKRGSFQEPTRHKGTEAQRHKVKKEKL